MTAVEVGVGDRFAALLYPRDAEAPEGRWEALRDGLADLGFDRVNYTVFDTSTGEDGRRVAANPSLSTLPRAWLDDYAERRLDLVDPLVDYVAAGGRDPILFDATVDGDIGEVARFACDGGMKAGVFVPLPGGPLADVAGGTRAGLVLGSSQAPVETRSVLRRHATLLMSVAHLFHVGAIGEVLRRRHGAAVLSARERDCLQAVAQGQRIVAVAHALSLAEVTVGMHLRNARRKLGARSLPEAVARGLAFRQIEPL